MDAVTRWKKEVESQVRKYARNHSFEQREDLEQDCYVAILEQTEKIEELFDRSPTEAKKYVHKLCSNTVIDYIRTEKRRIETEPMLSESAEPNPHTKPLLFDVSESELQSALSTLGKTERYIIDSLFFRGLSEADVAEQLGKYQQWVSREKEKAIQKLRAALEGIK